MGKDWAWVVIESLMGIFIEETVGSKYIGGRYIKERYLGKGGFAYCIQVTDTEDGK